MQVDIKKLQDTNAFSCLSCGKCTGTCPVSRYAQSFSPRQILTHSIHNSNPLGADDHNMWSCLTCRQCDEICPSDIKYIELIQLLRQSTGIENRRGTCSHGGILESISRIMTVPDIKQDRLGWITKDLKTTKDSEYLLFTGCLPYFDALFDDLDVDALNIARSTLKILNHFGVQPQVLQNEKCCGHDFFWNGDMKNFEKLAQDNLEQFSASGAKVIVTPCPECFRTIKMDYSNQFGAQSFRVIHISEFLQDKLDDGKTKLKNGGETMTFHDPCRLGRHLDIFDAPRDVLNAIEGVQLEEMSHNKKRAICCGVSGWMNCSQVSKSIQTQRLREAADTGAEVMVTACAKCKIHFQCALQDKGLNKEVNIKIKDLTEIVAESLH